MTQPIDREPMTTPYITQSQLDRAFPVAHSRKDAEPVGYQYRMKPEWHDAWVKWQPCEKANFDDYVKAPVVNGWQFDARALYTHPPEADKLLQQALAECERLRADAERYRWLRERHEGEEAETYCVFAPNSTSECLEPVGSIPGELDAAIDAARAKP